MKRIVIFLLALTLVIVALFGLSSCTLIDDTKDAAYTLESDDFNKTLAFGEEVSYSGLTIVKSIGENVTQISVTPDMVTVPIDTGAVGSQDLIISYNEKTFTVTVTVKYRAEFKVDGEVFETKYVLSSSELVSQKAPEKDGKIFVGWSPEIPETATGNMVFDAIYTDAVPELEEIEAEYSDKLSNIVLPSNATGKWVFVDADGTVGDIGKKTFEVKFVLDKSGEEIKRDTVTVNVAPKEVTFSNIITSFYYNGKRQIPTYTASESVRVLFIEDGVSNYTDAGTYEYELIVDDENYTGSLKGTYVINKTPITVQVRADDADGKILANEQLPKVVYDVAVFNNIDIDLSILGITVTDLNDIFNGAGEYTLTATVANPNFEVTVIDGKLTVESTTLNVGDPEPLKNTAFYEDSLSSIAFKAHPNGVWSWKTPNVTVGNAGKNTHVAVFTPTDTRYDVIEKDVEIIVDPKPLIFAITSKTVYDYDGREHQLTYTLKDANGKDYGHLEVTGNNAHKNANSYPLTIEVTDKNYSARIQPTLIINKINPETDFSDVFERVWSNTLKLSDIPLKAGYSWTNPDQKLTAGTHNISAIFTPEDKQNYNTISGTFKVVVSKINASIENVNNSYTFTYNGSAFTLDNIFASHAESELEFVYKLNGSTVVSALKDAGTYMVEITLPESTNHFEATAKTYVTINKANIDISNVAVKQNATYGDKLLDKITLPESTLGTWTIDGADENTLVGDAGNNVFTAIFTPNTENYNSKSVLITVEVAKYKVIAPTVPAENREQKYDGERHYSGISDGKGYTVTDNGGITVNTYSVTLKLESDNYIWADGTSADKTLTYKIVKADNEWKSEPTIKDKWQFGDTDGLDTSSAEYKAYSGTAIAKYGSVVITYAPVGSESFVSTLPTNAGKYIARFTATDDNAGTITADVPFEITKIVVSVPAYTAVYTYTGKTIKANIPTSLLYTIEDDGHVVVGTYNATIKLPNTTNYEWSDNDPSVSKQLEYKIEKATIIISELTQSNVTYGTALTTTAKTNFPCTLRYVYSDSENGTYTDTVPTNAGVYFVKAVAAGDFNLNGATSDPISFEIKRENATIDGCKELYETVYNGSEFNITGVTASNGVALVYAYVKDGASVEKIFDAGTYTVTITLPESKNYNGATKTVTVSVAKADIDTSDVDTTQSATYGDKLLDKITLPESTLGTWTIDGADENTLVGNAGSNSFTAIFTPNTENYNSKLVTITVEVAKKQIFRPIVSDKEYNGEYYNSGLTGTDDYKVTADEGGVNMGSYEVTLTLKDPDNCVWVGDITSDSITIGYKIDAAPNSWDTVPSITPTWEYESTGTVSADAKYGNVKIEYKPADADDSAYSETMPTLPGSYTARFTTTDTNYSILSEAIPFSITKKSITAPTVSKKEFVYTGSTINLGLVSNNEYTVKDSGGVIVNNYSAVLTLANENYKWAGENDEVRTKTFNYSIVKASVSFTDLDIEDWTFGEDASTPSVNKDFDCTVYYLYSDSENGTYTDTVPTKADTYFVKAVTDGNDNLNYSESAPISFKIKKIVASINGYEETYTEYYNKNGFDITDKGITASNGVALSYSYLYTSPEGNSGAVSAIMNAGTYTVTITLPETDNYLGDEVTVTVTIKQIENNDTIPDDYSATYGDKLTSLEVPTSTTGSWTWKDATADTTVGNAGEVKYTLVFTPTDKTNYAAREVEVTFTVKKKVLTVPAAKNPTSVYDNTTHYSGLTDTDLYTAKDDGGVDVGTYTATLTLVDSDNYAWTTADNTSKTATVSYSITKGTNELTNLAMPSWTYGDTKGKGTANAKYGDVLVEYKLADADDSAYSTTVPENAGSYIVRFTTTNTNCDTITNHLTFTISRRTVNVPQMSFTSTPYTGKKITSGIVSNDYYTVVDNGGIDATTYTVTITLNNTANCRWNRAENDTDPISYTYTVTRATVYLSNLSAGWTYDNFTTPTITSNVICSIQFLYSDTENGNYSTVIPTAVGNYYVKAVVAETKNYTAASAGPVAFSIGRATPTFADPYFTNKTYYQNSLNLSTSTYKAYNEGNTKKPVSGTFTFGDVVFVDEAGKSYVTLTFTPSNTTNYAPVEKTYYMTLKAAAYLDDASNTFGTIEEAVKAANLAGGGVVWVIPNVDTDADTETKKDDPIYIKGYKKTDSDGNIVLDEEGNPIYELNINAGVTLLLPFEVSGAPTRNTLNENGLVEGDSTVGTMATDTKCATKVIISDNVTVINSGTIEICGQLSGGGGNKKYSGQTYGSHGKILLGEGAKIESERGSKILCRGFISEVKENNGSMVLIKNGAVLEQPFVLCDHRGGEYLAAIYNKLKANESNYSPFNQYMFVNVTSMVRINYGGTMNALVNLQASSKQNAALVAFVATDKNSNAVIQLTDPDNSYLTAKWHYDAAAAQSTTTVDDAGTTAGSVYTKEIRCDLNIYGDVKTGSMMIKIVLDLKAFQIPISIDTADSTFPIPYFYHITLSPNAETEQASAKAYMNQAFKLLPGSSLTVNEGVSLTAHSLAVYYQDASSTETFFTDGNATLPYPSGLGAAEFNLGGMMVCTNFGGKINMLNDNVKIIITSAYELTTKEVTTINENYNNSSVKTEQTLKWKTIIIRSNGDFTVQNAGVFAVENGTFGSLNYSYITISDGIKSLYVDSQIYGDDLQPLEGYTTYTYNSEATNNPPFTSFFVKTDGETAPTISYVLHDGYAICKNGKIYIGDNEISTYKVNSTLPTGGGEGSWQASPSLHVTFVRLPKITVTYPSLESNSVVYNVDGSVTVTAKAKVSNSGQVLVATVSNDNSIVAIGDNEETKILLWSTYYSTVSITVKEDCTITLVKANASDYQQ